MLMHFNCTTYYPVRKFLQVFLCDYSFTLCFSVNFFYLFHDVILFLCVTLCLRASVVQNHFSHLFDCRSVFLRKLPLSFQCSYTISLCPLCLHVPACRQAGLWFKKHFS